MRDQHFAVKVTYDHGAISAIDVEEAIETALADRVIVDVTVVPVGRRLHATLTGEESDG